METNTMEKIAVPSTLTSVILTFAQTLDPSAHILDSSICVPTPYADAIKTFIEAIRST